MELIIENGVLKQIIGECTELIIPEGVTKIGDMAFFCAKIEKIFLPEGVAVIGESAFRGCSELRDVVLPESITEIKKCAFYGCTKIKKINFPKKLKTIHRMAFAFTGIINLIVPETVEFMAADAFHPVIYPLFTNESREDFFAKIYGTFKPEDCICLKKGVLESYTSTPWGEEIYIPLGVKGIGNTAFDKCILKSNFSRWSVKKIHLPTSVKQIGKQTFSKCKDITICACTGSYAEKYARERGLAFEAEEYL